jgi:hypothetical protein
MKKLVFVGHSDDTFGCYGPGIDVDHDDCANGSLRALKVTSGDVGLVVTGQYCPPNMSKSSSVDSWVVGIAKIALDDDDDEYMPLPDWPMRFVNGDPDYSPALEIDAPDDVQVKLIIPTEKAAS